MPGCAHMLVQAQLHELHFQVGVRDVKLDGGLGLVLPEIAVCRHVLPQHVHILGRQMRSRHLVRNTVQFERQTGAQSATFG